MSSISALAINKVLIANRGEIACRIMRTTKNLGIKNVAVYSEIDLNSLHVSMADEAFCLGPAPSQDSYLRMDKIISIAKKTNCQAIHPGYGFLSENADFAEMCEKSGIIFIGPPASAIKSMGIKSMSKAIMEEAGVPVIEGYHGTDQSTERLKEEAIKIGFPVLIKAVRGGGGKGMRIVESEDNFCNNLESARREAMKSFGDDAVLVEKFLDTPRHVEVQIFGDCRGNYVYLYERDCSVQRRHQKIIEESPAPRLTADVRRQLGEAAIRAARAVKYIGAGTVEFIMDSDQKFYFMEMNTRLQVEHPVTEMVTGTDLVEWQIKVAEGENLPLLQQEIKLNGHSFEARVYAENPEKDFMPGSGVLSHIYSPDSYSFCRIETGVRQGDTVPVFYDPMISKVVVWGPSRQSALKRLQHCLSEYNVTGIDTNVSFLMNLSLHPEFVNGNVHTNFIQQYYSELFVDKQLSKNMLCCAVITTVLHEKIKVDDDNTRFFDQFSPFSEVDGMRLNTVLNRDISLKYKEQEYCVKVQYDSSGYYKITFDNHCYKVSGHLQKFLNFIKVTCIMDCSTFTVNAVVEKNTIHLFTKDGNYKISFPPPKFHETMDTISCTEEAVAPMPGVIEKVFVNSGDEVKKGDPLMVIIAMKMEYVIQSPKNAIINKVLYCPGETVAKNAQLVTFS